MSMRNFKNTVNKRTVPRAVAIIMAMLLLFPAFTFFTYAEPELVTVIVSTENEAENDRLIDILSSKIKSFSLLFEYQKLINGFSAEIEASEFELLKYYSDNSGVSIAKTYYAPSIRASVLTELGGKTPEKFSGENTLVSVIDTGFDTSGNCFFLDKDTKTKLSDKNVSEFVNQKLINPGAFFSTKVPFVYDYADKDTNLSSNTPYGTIAASIIGGNVYGNGEFCGIAPLSQLMFMKVSKDALRTTDSAHLLAALEDSYTLGADIINIGFYSTNAGYDPLITKAINRLYDSNILVVSPAGDYGRSHEVGNMHQMQSGILAYDALYPDTGTMAYPATEQSVSAASSVINSVSLEKCLYVGSDRKTAISYTDTNREYEVDGKKTFDQIFDKRSLDYVIIGGVGEKKDFAAIGNISGKAAVIMRGTIPFAEKIKNAADAGAVAVIIYDNSDTYTGVLMDLTGIKTPSVFVSKESGEKLINSKSKVIYIESGAFTTEYGDDHMTVSGTSSKGMSYDLSCGPDVSVFGEGILCMSSRDVITSVSGTSIASASLCGEYLKLISLLKEQGVEYSSDYVRNLLASSADIIKKGDVLVSPRTQGAGFLNAQKASLAQVMIMSDNTSCVKLGDNVGTVDSDGNLIIKTSLSIKNLTSKEKIYYLSSSVQSNFYAAHPYSEGVTLSNSSENTISEASVRIGGMNDNLNIYSKNYTPLYFAVEADSVLELSVTVTLAKSEYEKYSAAFKNGFCIEGFFIVHSESDIETEVASMPYIGFVGNFDSLKILDSTVYDGASYYVNSGLYGHSDIFSRDILLGSVFENESVISRKTIAFSPNNDLEFDSVILNMSLLRDVKSSLLTVKDKSQRTVFEKEFGAMSKRLNAIDYTGITELWDGRAADNSSYVFPDDNYSLTFTVTSLDGKRETIEFDIRIDTKKPVVNDIYKSVKNGRTVLCIDAKDEFSLSGAVMYVSSYDLTNSGLYQRSSVSDASPVKAHTFEFDITDMPDVFYAEVVDSARNHTVLKVSKDEIKSK